MYQQTSSLTAESMNAANKSVRDCTVFDPINAMLLLLKLEATRFSKNMEKAWSWNEVLTPHGKKLSDKFFSKVNPRDYTITIDAELDKYVCTVSRMPLNYTSTCWFPSSYDEDNGSLFGGCSCGVPNTNGIPCHHMCAVVKLHRIDRLNETNVMPTWWHTSHWRKQYPSDSFVPCKLTFKVFAILLESIPTIPRISMSFVYLIQDPRKVEDQGKRNGSRGPLNLLLRSRRRPQRIRKRGRYQLNLMIRSSIGLERGRRR
jgi:hypothetical protein